jgi:hypothetical protein
LTINHVKEAMQEERAIYPPPPLSLERRTAMRSKL